MAKKQTGSTSLRDLWEVKLSALYDIEGEIIEALPKMIKEASDEELKKSLRDHLSETKEQARRIEKIFEKMGKKPQKLKVEAIRGLAKDADWVLKNVKGKAALDANIIAAAQYVEHYEMAGYGTAVEWADTLGEVDASELLQKTLDEERAADETLNELAIASINKRAAMFDEDTFEVKEKVSLEDDFVEMDVDE